MLPEILPIGHAAWWLPVLGVGGGMRYLRAMCFWIDIDRCLEYGVYMEISHTSRIQSDAHGLSALYNTPQG
jgi:hypothetical protein